MMQIHLIQKYISSEREQGQQLFRNNQGVFYYNELTGYRINTNPEYNKNPTDGNYDVITGIELHARPDQRGENWITPPTVFADWGDQTWEGHVGVSNLEFSHSISNIKIEDRGFGYLAPAEISIVDGKPSIDPTYKTLGGDRSHPFHQLDANFSKAIIRISEINEAGTILELNITDGGSGYEPTLDIPPSMSSQLGCLKFSSMVVEELVQKFMPLWMPTAVFMIIL
jgi:hypothetical protein